MPTELQQTAAHRYESAHNELLLRVAFRDKWFIINAAVIVTNLALLGGIEVLGVKATQTTHDILSFTWPISLFLLLCFIREERTISALAAYLRSLDNYMSDGLDDTIHNWYASPQYITQFSTETVSKVILSLVSFILIPIGLSLLWTFKLSALPTWIRWTWSSVHIVSGAWLMLVTLVSLNVEVGARLKSFVKI